MTFVATRHVPWVFYTKNGFAAGAPLARLEGPLHEVGYKGKRGGKRWKGLRKHSPNKFLITALAFVFILLSLCLSISLWA